MQLSKFAYFHNRILENLPFSQGKNMTVELLCQAAACDSQTYDIINDTASNETYGGYLPIFHEECNN